MRKVFYPAVIGWTLLGAWMSTLKIRMKLVEHRIENNFETRQS
jgi:heme exporter protein C